jgi:lysozyme
METTVVEPSSIVLVAIKGWEGCVLHIYADANSFPTIGWGHKLTHEDVMTGRFTNDISQAEANAIFLADCAPFQEQVNSLNLTLTQGQFDALFDFDFNLGIDRLQIMLGHGIDQVPQELPRWVFAGGVKEPGLVVRRAIELQWWNS